MTHGAPLTPQQTVLTTVTQSPHLPPLQPHPQQQPLQHTHGVPVNVMHYGSSPNVLHHHVQNGVYQCASAPVTPVTSPYVYATPAPVLPNLTPLVITPAMKPLPKQEPCVTAPTVCLVDNNKNTKTCITQTVCSCAQCAQNAARAAHDVAHSAHATAQPTASVVCQIPGCVSCDHTAQCWQAGAAARREAEHWVSRILDFPVSALASLTPNDFQLLINKAVGKTQAEPVIQATVCPIHGGHLPSAHCAPPKVRHDRKAAEAWVSKMYAIPPIVLASISAKELQGLVEAAKVRIS